MTRPKAQIAEAGKEAARQPPVPLEGMVVGHLAEIRVGEQNPAEADYRSTRKLVIRNVDFKVCLTQVEILA